MAQSFQSDLLGEPVAEGLVSDTGPTEAEAEAPSPEATAGDEDATAEIAVVPGIAGKTNPAA